MFRLRRKAQHLDPVIHRGRVWRDGDPVWWRYRCLDCDYGAASSADYVREVVWPWLMQAASDHANPEHWSRRRG